MHILLPISHIFELQKHYGGDTLRVKNVTVRIPMELIEYCERRIKEIPVIEGATDLSKFIRWLIKQDYENYIARWEHANSSYRQ